ncbi:hypothetical protein [Azospirillum palustre]
MSEQTRTLANSNVKGSADAAMADNAVRTPEQIDIMWSAASFG